ncbi:general stress protein [Planococcus sp. N028]|uniref:General stress protein n=1 Tax=Planococcus shixiaomingii TaxID=3058393 RepID=A0ABT8N5M6_9BACL|nr:MULTISPECIES: general stress protein [unclassified Planococcus (in: firmicutes)]MDN7243181.1 general stress protein [Planococcus sp. N028]WKA55125.1 general stress protein [Planococcus sp. N022]
MTLKLTVENALQAKSEVEKLLSQGYDDDNIYIFAHDKRRETDINEALDTESVGMKEQGFLNGMKNMTSSRGDELRAKMSAVGLSDQEAEEYEEELDKGKLVIIATKDE